MRVMPVPIQILYVIVLIPFLYFISFILYKILSRVELFRTCCSRIRSKIQAQDDHQLLMQRDDNIDEDIPDRIVNPDMYQPLLPSTNNEERNSQSECQTQSGVNSLVAYSYGSM